MKKYYIVVCKCGHVKRSQFVIKPIPVCAESGKKAAAIARRIARVKHDHKFAIISCTEVTREEYLEQLRIKQADPYFSVQSVQEQRLLCPEVYELAIKEDELPSQKRKTHERRRLVDQIRAKEMEKAKYNYE